MPRGRPAYLTPEQRLENKRSSRIRTYEKNKASVLAQAAIYRAAHKAEEKANRAAHYQNNKEHVAKTTKAYREANLDLYAMAAAKRRSTKRNAIPPWANLDAIADIYRAASLLTKVTGQPHEVDHVVPLQGKNVCGLHVETNLQILTLPENRSKSFSFDPGKNP